MSKDEKLEPPQGTCWRKGIAHSGLHFKGKYCVEWREQPAPGEPSAPAGGAREFWPAWKETTEGRSNQKLGEEWVKFAFAEAYAEQQVFKSNEAYKIPQLKAELAQLRQEAEAATNDLMRISKALNQPGTQLVPIADRAIKVIAELRQERDARANCCGDAHMELEAAMVMLAELGFYKEKTGNVTVWKNREREARERAQVALRDVLAEIPAKPKLPLTVRIKEICDEALKSSQEEGKL